MPAITAPNPRATCRRLLVCGLLSVTALLSACGPHMVTSNVLRFNEMAATPQGGTFSIAPEHDQEGSLEFRGYADLVARRLEAQGYRRTSNAATADMVVSVLYSVDDGRTEYWSTPIYSYNDYWRRYYGASTVGPYPYIEPIGTDTHSSTVFTHRLEVRISDGGKLRKGKRENLFEGRAVTERSTREPVHTVPALILALFENFPGQSGVPTTVRIPEPVMPR
ncbi:MAG: DUF4136 domain-containing protein [Magnetospirillum sp.]|nr:DUF4136 domain-containing protein [Magnetospirillum sp.]